MEAPLSLSCLQQNGEDRSQAAEIPHESPAGDPDPDSVPASAVIWGVVLPGKGKPILNKCGLPHTPPSQTPHLRSGLT